MATHDDLEDDAPSWWSFDELRDDDAPPAWPPAERADMQGFVRDMFKRSFAPAPPQPPPAEEPPDLAAAAKRQFEAAGLFGTPPPADAAPAGGTRTVPDGTPRLLSWKLPASAFPQTQPPPSAPVEFDGRRSRQGNVSPGTALARPEARTGLALFSADSLLRKLPAWAQQAAAGNDGVARQAVDAVVGWVKSLLPPEHHGSIDKTASVAAIDHQREMAARQDAERNRASLGVLAERRARAERDYQAAILGGEPARIAAARGELLDAAGVERRALGDSPAEANAGRRALESDLRARAMRHRFAQLDDAGLDRALQNDDDAKADPAAARRAVDDIRRIRREDPALAGAAAVEREIERRKRAGQITTAQQETETRTRLRLDAQARRGIPEDKRQTLTQDERRSASAAPPDAAADPPAAPAANPSDPKAGGEAKASDEGAGAGDKDYAERVARHRAAARRWLRARAGGTALADTLFDDIAKAADAARVPGVSTAERVRILNATLAHVAAATKDDPRLGIFFTRAVRSAFYIAAREPDAPAGDAVIKAAVGRSPAEAADAELAKENERDRAERQRSADARYQRFKRDRPQAGYGDYLAEIQRIAAQTGVLPEGALRHLMPDLTARDSSMVSRLRDPRKVIAQLDALRTIAASDAAAALPASLRDLVGDYEKVLSDPNRPRDPEELVYAVFRRGVPRRVQEVAGLAETAAEIVTPYGSVVELNDARKAAVAAHDAFAAGRNVEGLQKSRDVLWHLAMAAPLIGNVKRGIKAVSAAGKLEKAAIRESEAGSTRIRSEVEPQDGARRRIRENSRNGALAEAFAADEIAADLRAVGLSIQSKHRVYVPGDGFTLPDFPIGTKRDQIALYVEVKDGMAPFNSAAQRRRQNALGVLLIRVDREKKTITIFEPPYGKENAISREVWRERLKAAAERIRADVGK